jgi:putative membrane protein
MKEKTNDTLQGLDPRSVWYYFVVNAGMWLLFSGFFILPFGFVLLTVDVLISLVFSFVLMIMPLGLFYIWSALSVSLYKYELTDIAFKKEYGVINKRYVTIPFDRIQNVDIRRDLLARIMGLSHLHIQTAGSSMSVANGVGHSEGLLPGLSVEVAEKLRDDLIVRAKNSRSSGGV